MLIISRLQDDNDNNKTIDQIIIIGMLFARWIIIAVYSTIRWVLKIDDKINCENVFSNAIN